MQTLASPALEIVSEMAPGAACRVEAVARPRPGSAIRFELWLPPSEQWSGRYYQMGNGGFAGSIHRPTLAAAAMRGDAAAATDTGHAGSGFDARWAKGRDDLIEDYAARSIKVTADAAGRLIAAYYGRAAARRYFMGCSYGGRQALTAAVTWPRDWDGVIAGAPAVRWTEMLAGFAAIRDAVRAPGAWFDTGTVARWQAACAGRRGRCDTGAWLDACAARWRSDCPTAPQAVALRRIEQAGYPLGKADPAEWRRWIVEPDAGKPSQRTFADQAEANLFAGGAGRMPWLRRTFAVPDLSGFFARGGKVLSYLGEADAVTPPAIGLADYRTRAATAAGSYRLFMVPGMAHCQDGAAPHAFGQSLDAPALRDDPRHDIRRALEAWVEQGRVPDTLMAEGGKQRRQLLRARR